MIIGSFPAVNFRKRSSRCQRINSITKLTIDALLEINSAQHTAFNMCLGILGMCSVAYLKWGMILMWNIHLKTDLTDPVSIVSITHLWPWINQGEAFTGLTPYRESISIGWLYWNKAVTKPQCGWKPYTSQLRGNLLRSAHPKTQWFGLTMVEDKSTGLSDRHL